VVKVVVRERSETSLRFASVRTGWVALLAGYAQRNIERSTFRVIDPGHGGHDPGRG